MRRTILLLLLMVSGLQFACGASVDNDPARDDSFLSQNGKSDTVAIQEETPEANGILRVVNEASHRTLDDSDKIGLDSRAARNIVEHRTVNRGIHSLAELDSIEYVGTDAFMKLFEYAFHNGYFSRMIHDVLEGSPHAEAILDVVNVASLEILDADVGLDARAAKNIIDYRLSDDIDSLAELDRIAYVGKSAFGKLATYTVKEIDHSENNNAYLQQMAEDIGEYFFYERTQYESGVTPVINEEVPTVVSKAAQSFATDAMTQSSSAELTNAEPTAYYAITRNGELIGYVVNVEYTIDLPVFDGGGVHLYLNPTGEVVVEVAWWG